MLIQNNYANSFRIVEGTTEYYFKNTIFSVYAPTKCGSTTMARFMESSGISEQNQYNALINRHHANMRAEFVKAPNRVMVIRKPIERWKSGILELAYYNLQRDKEPYIEQDYKSFYTDHIGPIYSIQYDSDDLHIIHLSELSKYTGVHMNSSIQSKRHYEDLLNQMNVKKNPFVRILYERDKAWLLHEQAMYESMCDRFPVLSVGQWRSWVQESLDLEADDVQY